MMLAAPWPLLPATSGLSFTSSPSRATHLLLATFPIGTQPLRFLPSKSGRGFVHFFGIGRSRTGAFTPAIIEPSVASPRFSMPASLSASGEVSSQLIAGPELASCTTTISLPDSTLASVIVCHAPPLGCTRPSILPPSSVSSIHCGYDLPSAGVTVTSQRPRNSRVPCAETVGASAVAKTETDKTDAKRALFITRLSVTFPGLGVSRVPGKLRFGSCEYRYTPICSGTMQREIGDSQPSCSPTPRQFASPFPLHLNLA